MKTVLIGLAMTASLALHAQTAKVIQLTAAEAIEAKSLHEQQKAIAEKLDALEKRIQTAHLLDKASETRSLSGGQSFNWLPGWTAGEFEYSEDYRFIVPSSWQKVPTTTMTPGVTLTPYVTPYAAYCCNGNVVLGNCGVTAN